MIERERERERRDSEKVCARKGGWAHGGACSTHGATRNPDPKPEIRFRVSGPGSGFRASGFGFRVSGSLLRQVLGRRRVVKRPPGLLSTAPVETGRRVSPPPLLRVASREPPPPTAPLLRIRVHSLQHGLPSASIQSFERVAGGRGAVLFLVARPRARRPFPGELRGVYIDYIYVFICIYLYVHVHIHRYVYSLIYIYDYLSI